MHQYIDFKYPFQISLKKVVTYWRSLCIFIMALVFPFFGEGGGNQFNSQKSSGNRINDFSLALNTSLNIGTHVLCVYKYVNYQFLCVVICTFQLQQIMLWYTSCFNNLFLNKHHTTFEVNVKHKSETKSLTYW